MTYIKRTLEQIIWNISDDYSCILLIDPRQVGKTTMLEHLMEGTKWQKVIETGMYSTVPIFKPISIGILHRLLPFWIKVRFREEQAQLYV
ncbi:MAG: hypothetical protein IJV16_07030 [Lachnospiraceae bacterium]|nr:hypothetical protein [Lachnospiraceae bacterium]